MSAKPKRICLTGATGDVGGQVVRILEKTGIPLCAISRRPEKADELRKSNVDVLIGSLDDPVQDLTSYLSGCDTLFLLTAATPNQRKQCFNSIDAAVLAGVKWIVKLSAADARDDGNVPWVKDHAAADRYLESEAEKHGISWTILRASAFMQNLLSEAAAVKRGFLPQSCGNGRAGWVDTGDVAAVAAEILKEGSRRHHGRKYIITGPQLISLPEVADAFSRQIGHRVRYLDLPGPVFRLLLRFGGADSWTANALVAQFNEIVRPNKEGIEVSNDVRRVTGRPPKSFEQWVKEHRKEFEGMDLGPFIGIGLIVLIMTSLWLVSKMAREMAQTFDTGR